MKPPNNITSSNVPYEALSEVQSETDMSRRRRHTGASPPAGVDDQLETISHWNGRDAMEAPRLRRTESPIATGDSYREVGESLVRSVSKPVLSDTAAAKRTGQRTGKRRADILATIRGQPVQYLQPEGTVWACCCSSECLFDELHLAYKRGVFDPTFFSIATSYSQVIFCRAFESKQLFLFKFGCIVGWDFTLEERVKMLNLLQQFQKPPAYVRHEEDEMCYVWSDQKAIKQDTIHLVSDNAFEKLSYSYAFAQCVKLAYFESNVDDTIERTRSIPESLAKTGKISSNRADISRRIGELFTSRFYINLHTDILDTPDIFWEFDEFSDHYSSCRSYLEIPKRVDILNQRLDIIKDLYDMLNDELTIQHGHRLEWIIIYLICVEVAIEVIWNILIKDVLKLV